MVLGWLPIVVANVWWSGWLSTTPKGEIVVPSVRIGVCVVVVGTDIKAFVSWHVLRQFWDLKCWFDDEEPNFEKRYEKLISLMIWSLNEDLRCFPSLWSSCGSVERVLKLLNLNFRFQQNFGFDRGWLKN